MVRGIRLVLVRNTRSRKRWIKLLIGKGPLLQQSATVTWERFVRDPRSLRRSNSGTPPNQAIPGVRPTPRPREPKPTPGTVAFPLAPLQCRSSIYTTSGVENPPALKIKVKDPAAVARYAFGTRTAEFHVCVRCGVVPVVTSEIAGRLYAVVNVNTFDGVDAALLRRSPANFDGEGTDSRLERRARNWIGRVQFTA